jgi:hypothetical protein
MFNHPPRRTHRDSADRPTYQRTAELATLAEEWSTTWTGESAILPSGSLWELGRLHVYQGRLIIWKSSVIFNTVLKKYTLSNLYVWPSH